MEASKRGIQPVPPATDIDSEKSTLGSLFVHSVTVGWGDCDPAQIAYTANIPGWGLKAIEHWYAACLGVDWFDLNIRNGVGTPFVSLNFDFLSPITNSAILEMSVYVSRLGSSSIHHVVDGHQSGVHCFTGKTTAAFVAADRMKAIPIPDNMRSRITHYQSIQERNFAS